MLLTTGAPSVTNLLIGVVVLDTGLDKNVSSDCKLRAFA